MKITDLNGEPLVITNLNKALAQANRYRQYRHVDPAFNRLSNELQKYWEDVYVKLSALKQAS